MSTDYTAIIQARTGSTRLPQKVLLPLSGKTVLEQVLARVKKSKLINQIIVATTIEENDKKIADLSSKNKVKWYCGSVVDVLDRYYQAAKLFKSKHIIRITSDCPLIDPKLIDTMIKFYKQQKTDYAANILEESFPDGEDIEIFTFSALKQAWQNAKLPSEREHVTPYIRNHPELFSLSNYNSAENLSHLRWTLDESKDYKFIKKIYQALYLKNPNFGISDIMKLLKHNPSLLNINQHIGRNEGYQKSLMEDKIFLQKTMGKGQTLYQEAKKIIPGGTQLLSKRPEMFLPDLWPAYYSKAKGCEIWDLDGKKYIDMAYMGIGAALLGYADFDVDQAVKKAVDNANTTTLNAPEEVELAQKLLKLHPWAQMVRYARTGGEAMAIAVRIARAATNKDKILFCGYHGWHDWYLAANLSHNQALDGHLLPGLEPSGVPRGLLGTAIPFEYNNIQEFLKLYKKNKAQLAAVVMEPIRSHLPNAQFLETIRKLTEKGNIPLVFDEVTSGFRLAVGGAHLKFGVNPDLAVFAKGIGNGYPMAAIIGKKKYMDATQNTFISSTYWTDRIGPIAALTTIKKIKAKGVIGHLRKIGKMIQEGWQKLAKKHDIKINISGIYPLGHFNFEYPNGQAIKTLMTQIMLDKGYLATNAFYASYAHKSIHVIQYLEALDATFAELKKAIVSKTVEEKLRGPVSQTGFKRLI